MSINDQSAQAMGYLKGWVGGVAFDSTSLMLMADESSEDFVIQASWRGGDGRQRELIFYIPERGREPKVYRFPSIEGAGAYYEIAGERTMDWQGGSITRERVDFTSSDSAKWQVLLGFNFEVNLDGQAVWIKGEGQAIGASPWGKSMRQRFALA